MPIGRAIQRASSTLPTPLRSGTVLIRRLRLSISPDIKQKKAEASKDGMMGGDRRSMEMTMKLLSIPRQPRDCYPYVITAAFGGFVRNRMDLFVSDRPGATADAFDAAAVGYRGPGRVSPTVRRRLLDFFSQRVRRSGSGHCVVFGENDCVHLLPDGTMLTGHAPPRADTLDPRDFDAVPYPLIDLWHVALPEGSAAAHLCVRRLAGDRIELSSGAPCILGALDEYDDDGVDPAAPHLDAEGRFVPPAMFRGAKVTGVRDERILLGPIQPDGGTRRVVAAWPQEVRAACVEVARRRIPDCTFERVWRIVDPANTDLNWVGVLEAA